MDNSWQINVEEIKAVHVQNVGKNSRGMEVPFRKPKFRAPAKTPLMLFADQEAESLQAEDVCSQCALRGAGDAALQGSWVLQNLPSPETWE